MPTITADNGTIHYEVHGEGTPILFVHPPVLSSHVFAYQANALSKDLKVILFDMRGHGKSTPSNQRLTYPVVVEDIRRVLDACKVEKAFICGYSMGSTVTLDFLYSYPDRVSGAVLIGGFSKVDDFVLKALMSLGTALARPGLYGVLVFGIALANADKLGSFVDMFRDGRQANARDVHTLFEYGLHYNGTTKLDAIHHPILLVYGDNDTRFHRYARSLHEKLQNAQFVFISNVPHQIPTKAADKLNLHIRQFIQAHSPAPIHVE